MMKQEPVGILKIQSILREVQGNRKSISWKEARSTIQTQGGTSWPSGTTLESILQRMHDCNLIVINGNRVQVLDYRD